MENYKEINRELIDANREMRLHIASYQKEVVQLRAELIEQRRVRVEFERDYRTHLVSVLTRNFREALEEVDPMSSLLDVLGGDTANNATKHYSTIDCRSDTSTGRRSSLILNEFRRSSAVLRRRSAVGTSPTRRRSAEGTPTTLPPKHNSNASTTEKDVVLKTTDNTDKNDENFAPETHLQIINEMNEGELSGNTNLLNNPLSNDSCPGTKELCGPTRMELVGNTNLSNNPQSNDSCPGTKELCGPTRKELVVRRGKQRSRTYDCKEDSVEEPRLVLRTSNEFTTTPADFFSDGYKPEDNTSCSPSMALSELMMQNFIDAPCSTPCSISEVCSDNFKRQVLRSHAGEISNATLSLVGSYDQTTSGRPTRRCAPRCLTEPSLGAKLRNESATNKKKKGRKK